MDVPLVGRATELAALTAATEAAERGDGRMVLLSGEAGIGKTRLAAHALGLARERGFTILQGQADPLRTGLAYAPVVEALRPHLAAWRGSELSQVLDELPDLGRLFSAPGMLAPAPLADPKLERTRIFEAVLALVGRLAETAPTLLFVDDLHWADRGSVELVHHIACGVAGLRVLVLATYRTGELVGAHNDLAVAVRRRRPDAELALRPLADRAVAELVRDLMGVAPPPELVSGVTARARGVPLFVTALVQGGPSRSGPGVLPTIVRDVVLGRLHRLTESERRLLEIVAVAGNAGSAEVLRRLWRDDSAVFDAALPQLIAGGLVEERMAGWEVTYRVAHPLYAEVAYADLTMAERQALHAATAETIDALDPGNVLALAPHYRDAGSLVDARRAVEVLAAAGQRALGLYAAEEAVDHFEAALSRARPPAWLDLVPRLLDGLGHAYQGHGRLDDAAAAWSDALAHADRDGDQKRRAALRTQLALLESERGNFRNAHEHAEAALFSSRGEDARAIMICLVIAIRHGDTPGLRALLERAFVLTEGGSSHAARAISDQCRSYLAILDGNIATAHRGLRQAVHQAELCSGDAPLFAHGARRQLAGLSVLVGDIAGGVEHAMGQRMTQARFQLPAAQCSTQFILANTQYFAGDLVTALTEIDLGIACARRMGLRRLIRRMLAFRAFLLAELGRSKEARSCLAEAAIVPSQAGTADDDESEVGVATGLETAAAAIAWHSGYPEQAPPPTEFLPLRDPMVNCLRLVFAGSAAAAAGDVRTAEHVAEAFRELGRTAPLLDALADRQAGLLSVARGDIEPAQKLLRSAADRLEEMGAPLLSGQALLEWAEIASGAEQRDAVAHCLTVFDRCGAAPWADRGRRLARSLGQRIQPVRTTGRLSRRESDVVRLVADGLSNADIASRLFLSERTIETHLRNSYKRLGLTSRVVLARWAAENLVT